MTDVFDAEIAEALGHDKRPEVRVTLTDPATLPSAFDVTGLATASLRAAMAELAALKGARALRISQRLTLRWFDMTLRPIGWQLPAPWDAVAGDYRTKDGWIRLHTNAAPHRRAALAVLGTPADRAAVAECVAGWEKEALEAAVVAAGGAAAAMRSLGEWQAHPQGRAVAAEPLLCWRRIGTGAAPVPLEGVKILDFTRVLAGPAATRLLAGFGARVLRIDPPFWKEPAVDAEMTLGKICAGLDLRRAEDRAQFEALAREADLILHGYRHGALEGLGYPGEVLAELAPHAVQVALDAYGWSGPWAGRRGFDSLVQMSSGIAAEGMRLRGAEKPVPLPVQALDHATGYLAAAGALRALRRRNATGEVLALRLSLARTAALLIRGGAGWREGTMPAEAPDDLATGIEETSWGPARRIAFPATLDAEGAGPRWRLGAGALRRHAAHWPE